MISRRRFLSRSIQSSILLSCPEFVRSAFGQTTFNPAEPPVRLAVLGSTYTLGSCLQSIADRFLTGYPWEGDWHMPNVQVVSVYVDALAPKFRGPMEYGVAPRSAKSAASMRAKVPRSAASAQKSRQIGPPRAPVAQSVTEVGRRRASWPAAESTAEMEDLSVMRSREFGFRLCRNIPEALRAGGERLAVDAVLTVIEEGDYPKNDLGQVLLPCYDFFQQCAQVFEEERRAAPYFNFKQLSFSFSEAKEMVSTAKRLRFPLMAGSTLPVTWRLPDIDMPMGARVREAVMVGIDEPRHGNFDALEALQCMLERRKGGETGVKAVQLLEGDDVWNAGSAGRWSKDLLSSALSRSDTPLGLTLLDGRTQDLVASGVLPQLVKNPAAYCVEYRDGTRATLLMLDGAVMDFNFAARLAENGLVSAQFLLPPTPNVTNTACLAAKIEQMFVTRRTPYPVERTLLTSGLLESCLESKRHLNQRLETPQLAIRYQPSTESQYARA